MTEGEFFRAADEAIVTSCDRLESHLFRESAASHCQMTNGSAAECVPITKLSRILWANLNSKNEKILFCQFCHTTDTLYLVCTSTVT